MAERASARRLSGGNLGSIPVFEGFYIGGRWEVAKCYTAESQQWLAVALRVGGSVELYIQYIRDYIY